MRRISRALGAGALTLSLSAAGLAVFARPAAADASSDAAYFEGAINQLRISKGLPVLSVDPRLVNMAQTWSNAMLASDTLSHNPSLASQAPADWTYLGENVGVGGATDLLQQAFTNSPEHYANMVDPHYNAFGVSVALSPSGTIWVTEDYEFSPSAPSAVQTAPTVSDPRPPAPRIPANLHPTQGYRMVAADGGVFTYGTAAFDGSTGGMRMAAPVVGMASTPDNGGYWLVASDGGVFSFGDAAFHGSTGAMHLNAPITGMASTPDGGGYWLIGSDGAVFAFGDAAFYGSAAKLYRPAAISGIAPTPSGHGYWLVGRDGSVYAFGDARFLGSPNASHLSAPVVGIASSPDGGGYWLAGADGGIFSFGDAAFHGSAGSLNLHAPIAAIQTTPDGGGYRLVASDGGVFCFGDAEFDGSAGGLPLVAAVRGAAG